MKVIPNPAKVNWPELCKRPVLPTADLETQTQKIINQVRCGGDAALKELTQKLDAVQLSDLRVSAAELELAAHSVSPELKKAIALAAKNIRTFHAAQQQPEPLVETTKGVKCWRKSVPIQTVGLYIPGGSAPLFSTLLMLAIPAQLAGCERIFVCTPPGRGGEVPPTILYTAAFLNIKEIYKIGGAQAIAAMSFGTESIPKADKIFGPGNQFVTKAKEMVQRYGVSIDLPAGPSELLVIADHSADADFVAADLLAQAEHGPDSQVVLLTNSSALSAKVKAAMQTQLRVLPRRQLTEKALKNSFAVVFPSLHSCLEFSNLYAPEHLILAVKQAQDYIDYIQNAGSVFVGPYSCESAGDYASGTNHTLPTNGQAKSYSGVSLDSFVKKITFQRITKKGLQRLGTAIEVMADAEQLPAHKNAVSIRLKN